MLYLLCRLPDIIARYWKIILIIAFSIIAAAFICDWAVALVAAFTD